MTTRQSAPQWNSIFIVIGDVTVTGSYWVDKTDWMTVRLDGGGSKSSRGGPAAESVARMMLGELHAEAKR